MKKIVILLLLLVGVGLASNWLVQRILQQQAQTTSNLGAIRQQRRFDPNNFAASANAEGAKFGSQSAIGRITQSALAGQRGSGRDVSSATIAGAQGVASGAILAGYTVVSVTVKESIVVIGGEKYRLYVTTITFANGKTVTTRRLIKITSSRTTEHPPIPQ